MALLLIAATSSYARGDARSDAAKEHYERGMAHFHHGEGVFRRVR
jgi:hypothetical protein